MEIATDDTDCPDCRQAFRFFAVFGGATGTLINTQLQLGAGGPAHAPTVSTIFSTWSVRAAAEENR